MSCTPGTIITLVAEDILASGSISTIDYVSGASGYFSNLTSGYVVISSDDGLLTIDPTFSFDVDTNTLSVDELILSGRAKGEILFIADNNLNVSGDATQLYWNSELNRLGVGQALPQAKLHIDTDANETEIALRLQQNNQNWNIFGLNTGSGYDLVLHNSSDSGNGVQTVYRNSNNPSNNDIIQTFYYQGQVTPTGGESTFRSYGQEIFYSSIVASGSYAAAWKFYLADNTILKERIGISQSEIVFNEDADDIDVRMEGSSDANLLYLDAGNNGVAIGANAASSFKLQVAGDIGPNANNSYDLGSSSLRFADIYLTGTLDFGTVIIDESSSNVATISATLNPSSSGNRNLGTSSLPWKEIYLSSGAHLGSYFARYSTSGVDLNTHFLPNITNAYDLGNSSLKWRNIYAGSINVTGGIGGSFTDASVLFAHTDGTITEDNANFYYTNADNSLNLGGDFLTTISGQYNIGGASLPWDEMHSNKFIDIHDIRHYGATGDGVTDNASAIQDAIDQADDYSYIYIPEGTFAIGSTLTINKPLRIYGEGLSSQLYVASNNFKSITITSSDVHIKDICISGDDGTISTTGQYGIYATGTTCLDPLTNISVVDCYFYDIGRTAINFNRVYDFTINNNVIEDVYRSAISITCCARGKAQFNRVDRVWGDAGVNYGIVCGALNSNDKFVDADPSGIIVSDNVVSNVFYWEGLDTHGGIDIIFANNHVYGCQHGIILADSRNALGDTANGRLFLAKGNVIIGNTIDRGSLALEHGASNNIAIGAFATTSNITGSITSIANNGGYVQIVHPGSDRLTTNMEMNLLNTSESSYNISFLILSIENTGTFTTDIPYTTTASGGTFYRQEWGNCIVANNYIRGYGTEANDSSSNVYGSIRLLQTKGCVVSNNTLERCIGDGISIANSVGYTCSNNTFIDQYNLDGSGTANCIECFCSTSQRLSSGVIEGNVAIRTPWLIPDVTYFHRGVMTQGGLASLQTIFLGQNMFDICQTGVDDPGSVFRYRLNATNNMFKGSLKIGDVTSFASSMLHVIPTGTQIALFEDSSLNDLLEIESTGITINDDGIDLDFRVESDTDSNCFYIDGASGTLGMGLVNTSAKLGILDSSSKNLILTNTINNATIKTGTILGARRTNVNTPFTIIGCRDNDVERQVYIGDSLGATVPAAHRILMYTATGYDETNNGGFNRLDITTAGATFNEVGEDFDFRIESDGYSNMFVLDGALNNIAIGTSVQSSYTLAVRQTTPSEIAVFENTTGSNLLSIWSSSLVVNENQIDYDFNYRSINVTAMLNIDATFNNVGVGVAGSTNSSYTMSVRRTSTTNIFLVEDSGGADLINVHTTGLVFNDSSSDFDLRFEGDNDANLFFLDAGLDNIGIGTNSPSTFKLQVAGSVGPNANNTYDLGSSSLSWKDIYLTGNLDFGTCVVNEVGINQLQFTASLLPTSSGVYNLGTSAMPWKDIYLTSGSLYLGDTQIRVSSTGIDTTNHILPRTDSLYDLGHTSIRWRHLYVDDLTVTNGLPAPGGFTQASVLFAHSDGTITEDNTNFKWDDTNNRLCVGTMGTGVAQGTINSFSSTFKNICLYSATGDGTNKGGVIVGARKTNANNCFTGLGLLDDGSVRTVYFGGGAWGMPDATILDFYVASAYNETNNAGVSVLKIQGTGLVINDASNDFDFRIESDGNANMFVMDGGLNNIAIGTSVQSSYTLAVRNTTTTEVAVFENATGNNLLSIWNSAIVVNENQAVDYDFRIRTSGVTNMFWVDGTFNNVGVGVAGTTRSTYTLAVRQTDTANVMVVETTAGTSLINVYTTGTVFNEGSNAFDFRVESDSDSSMLHVDGTNNSVGIGRTPLTTTTCVIQAPAAGHTSTFRVETSAAFSLINCYLTEVVFNEDSRDHDLRIETDGDANCFFVDGGQNNIGIGTNNPASFKLQVAGNVGPHANNTYALGSTSLRWTNLYLTGIIDFGTVQIDEVAANDAEINADWIPSVDSTYALGTTTKRWSNVWTDQINGAAVGGSNIYAVQLRTNSDQTDINSSAAGVAINTWNTTADFNGNASLYTPATTGINVQETGWYKVTASVHWVVGASEPPTTIGLKVTVAGSAQGGFGASTVSTADTGTREATSTITRMVQISSTNVNINVKCYALQSDVLADATGISEESILIVEGPYQSA